MYEMFIEILSQLGGKASNAAMLEYTGWEKQEYLVVRETLVKNGVIKLARGRGGSVVLVDATVINVDDNGAKAVKVVDPFPEGWR